jgi:predicted GNAT family N-acyltransferase
MVGLLFFSEVACYFCSVTALQFRLISTNSPAYKEMISLRMRVLLAPIGIPQTYINPQKEAADLLLGAYQNEVLIGCCILTALSASTVQLRQMAVETSLQKRGAGVALLQYAETLATENGYRELVMHARDAVLPFYQKCGYRVCSEPFFEVGISHHKMKKDLSPAEA